MSDEPSSLLLILFVFVATGVASPLLISFLQESGACESTTLLFVLPNYLGMALSFLLQPKGGSASGFGYVEIFDTISEHGVADESGNKAIITSSPPPPPAPPRTLTTPPRLLSDSPVPISPSRAARLAAEEEKKNSAIPHFLILFLCIIDAISAGLNLTGLVFCGSAVFTVVYSSMTLFTALFSRFILGRRLNILQWVGILIIVAGLSLTSVFVQSGGAVGPAEVANTVETESDETQAASSHNTDKIIIATDRMSDSSRVSLGIVMVVSGSLLHSLSYILSEVILTTFKSAKVTPFRLSSTMGFFGLAVFGIWQIFYTMPRFQVLVIDEIHKHSGVMLHIVAAYSILVVSSLMHSICFFSLIQRVGSTTTGVLKGLQSVLVFVLSHYFFCGIQQPMQCFTNTKGISLGLVLFGCFFYSYFSEADDQEQPSTIDDDDTSLASASNSSSGGSLAVFSIERSSGFKARPNFSFHQLSVDLGD